MNPRSFLVRGLLVGLVAGLLAFGVAFFVGEPHVERAISLESSGAAAPAAEESDGHSHEHGDDTAAHSHGEEGVTEVSRGTQRTWGLLTATVSVGVALGGLVALVSAAAAGRLGRLTLRQSTLAVSGVGFVAVALVPYLKYPPNPPAVGSGDTIGSRTAVYFGVLALSVIAAYAAVLLARRVSASRGGFEGTVAGFAAYVVVMVVVTTLMPTVDELGDFPASTLWSFRLASLFTLATTWAVIGVGLAWTLGRLQDRAQQQAHADAARRDLAASL